LKWDYIFINTNFKSASKKEKYSKVWRRSVANYGQYGVQYGEPTLSRLNLVYFLVSNTAICASHITRGYEICNKPT